MKSEKDEKRSRVIQEMMDRLIAAHEEATRMLNYTTTELIQNIHQHREIIKTFAIISGTIAAFTLLLFASPFVQHNVLQKTLLVAAVFFLLLTIGIGLFKLKNRNERDNKALADSLVTYRKIRDAHSQGRRNLRTLMILNSSAKNFKQAKEVYETAHDKATTLMNAHSKKMESKDVDHTLRVMLWLFSPALLLIFLALLLSVN